MDQMVYAAGWCKSPKGPLTRHQATQAGGVRETPELATLYSTGSSEKGPVSEGLSILEPPELRRPGVGFGDA